MKYVVEKDCTSEGDGSGNPVKVIKPQKADTHIEFYDDGSGDGSAEDTSNENSNTGFLAGLWNGVKNAVNTAVDFVEDIVEDCKNYDQYNESEENVLESNYFSSYKGAPVLRTNGDRSGSFGVIFLTRETIDWERYIENRKSSVRCKVEHAFKIIKCEFGYRKVRYRGLAKNANRLFVLFACANLLMCVRAGRKLIPIVG